MKRPPAMPPTYTTDAVEVMRQAKRKHTPEAALQALANEGWTLIRLEAATTVADAMRWRVAIDDVFANPDGTVDAGAYEDMGAEEAIELGAALIAAGRYVNGDVDE